MNVLKRLFTAPAFEDEIKTQQAYLLNAIAWTLIFVPIPYAIFIFLNGTDNPGRVLFQVVFGEITNIIILVMLRRGFVRRASIFQVIAIWFFFTALAATRNGVQGTSYLIGYGLVIVIAGTLLGRTGTIIFTSLSLMAGGLMVYAQATGMLNAGFSNPPLITWIVSLVLFPVGAVLQYLAGRTAQNALLRARASEERYRLISKVSSDYMFSTEVDGAGNSRLNWVAGAFEEITGYTCEEYIATGGWSAHLHSDDIERDAQDMSELQKKKPIITEIRTHRKDGSLRWVQVSAQPVWDDKLNRLSGIVGAVKDITERKQAEEALRKSEAIYRQAIEVAGAVPYHQTFDSEGRINYEFMGQGIRHITGYGPEEFTDDLWGALVLERHLLEELEPYSLDEAIQRVRQGQNPIWKCEYRIQARDGKIRWVFEAAVDLRNERGIAYGSVGMYQDITERKQSEKALRDERDLLQIFMDNIPDLVYFKDIESRFIRINKAHAQFLKLENPEKAIGKTDFDFQPQELAQQFMDEDKQIIATGQPVNNRIEFNPAADRQPRWLSASKVPVEDSSGTIVGTIGITRDITEQKKSRENLQRVFVQQAAILNNIPDMAWLKDKDSRYLAVNEQFAKTAGMKTSEILGKSDLEIWRADLAANYIQDDLEVMRSGQRKRIEEFQTDSTGRQYWVETTKTPITNEQGEVIGTTGISRDISDRKQVELIERRRREMLEKTLHLGQRVTEAADLRTTLERVWHGVHDDLGFDRLGIFLYNAERNSMDAALGTNNQGQIVEEWDQWFPLEGVELFARVLEKPDGLYFTRHYDMEYDIEETSDMYGVKEFAAVAARSGDKPIAIICVDNLLTQSPITDEQLEALRLFAGYAGLAIENARLNDALQKELNEQKQAEEREAHRRAVLEKVVILGQRVTEVQDIRTTLMKIWHGIHDDLNFDRLGIFLYSPETNSVQGTFGTNNHGEMVDEWNVQHPLDKNNVDSFDFIRVLQESDGLYFTHNYDIEHNAQKGTLMYGVKDYAAVAAWAGDKPVAVITVDRLITQYPITDEQLEALRLFAGYAGLAIENARLNDALQKELTQRQNLIDELESKNAELERFTYTVSHDLKSPLVTITGFLGYLEKDALAGNAEKMKSSINRISSAAGKMQMLLNDLLELSRIGRLMNPPEDISFTEIVNDAVDHMRGKLDEVNAVVEIQRDLPIVSCDRIRMVEVIQNLIENAAKYSHPNSNPRIEIGAQKDEQGQFVFYIRDNGIGIAPQYHENIFGLFNKLNATSEGTGIGLTLVKRIIEIHGGHIWVESEADQGATFYFTLPYRHEE